MKNDKTYFLQFRFASGKAEKYYPLQVYPFEWEGVEFFVHRITKGFEGNMIESKDFWGASHKETGSFLPVETTTMASAKKIALEKLENAGLDKIKAEIEKAKEPLR